MNGQIITTIAGIGNPNSGACGGCENCQATTSMMINTEDVKFDVAGNMYIAEGCVSSLVEKVDLTGNVQFVAGNCFFGYSGDGGPATAAELKRANSIAFDAKGNLYIADLDAMVIRMVDTSGIISTFAGNGQSGFYGDGGPATAAEFNGPSGIAFDTIGNLYIVDQYNNRVRKIDLSGTISTVVGTGIGGWSGDGGLASAAELGIPSHVIFDKKGNMYIAEDEAYGSNVRMVNSSGIITTVAGRDSMGYSGDNGPATAAKMDAPIGMAFDVAGNLYIADCYNNVIREVNASTGIITTVAGNGYLAGTYKGGFSGDGGIPTSAELFEPTRISFDNAGNLYIPEFGNSDVRKVASIPTKHDEISQQIFISIYPNPAKNLLNIDINSIKGKVELTIYNVLGERVINETSTDKSIININTEPLPSGLYFIHLQTEDGTITNRKVEIVK